MSIFRSRLRSREPEQDKDADQLKDNLLQVTEGLRAALLQFPDNGLQPIIKEQHRDRA